jgi:predicted house-cleaning noncanonical NTP pyrophosphatase (MazG superfamily)
MTGHEYVTEGRPNVSVDWKAEYAKQRKDRLADSIHEYLEDSDVSILEFYNDLRDIIVEINTYHKTFAEKAEGALLLVHGKPKTENGDVEPPAEAWNG